MRHIEKTREWGKQKIVCVEAADELAHGLRTASYIVFELDIGKGEGIGIDVIAN